MALSGSGAMAFAGIGTSVRGPHREHGIRVVIVLEARSDVFQVIVTLRSTSRFACTAWIAGSNRATKTPMIPNTMSSSESVSPYRDLCLRIAETSLLVTKVS